MTSAAAQMGTHTSFGPLKQIDAGDLNVGYAEAGPAGGTPVVLLHGCSPSIPQNSTMLSPPTCPLS
jgi:hypothetical protein